MTRRKPIPSNFCPGCQLDPTLLGEVRGKLDMIHETQQTHGRKLDAMDVRMRKNENRMAAIGGAAGLIVSIGIEFAKSAFRRS